MNDVILFGEGILDEWTIYKLTLDLFRNSTDMLISDTKSTFLEFGMEDPIIKEIKQFFPFEVKDLNQEFKYLGYYLEPNNYIKQDWMWLVRKVENIINQWCNRWLSLGEKMILVKDVLKIIPVYWFSLAKIPSSILELIRRMSFNFLWDGNKQRSSYHLSKWQDLSRPKACGGWGLKHLFHFGKALETKSLWRGVFGTSMWHESILEKYLKNKPLDIWLRDS